MHLAFKLEDVPGFINNSLRSLSAWLCEFIYPGIAKMYELFINIGTLVYEGELTEIYNKISLIIGIFMLFRITFWLIELLLDPDKIKDKDKSAGNVIKNVFISILLLALTPSIFRMAFQVQQTIISNGIIENIIYSTPEDANISQGNYMAAELFKNFYKENDKAIYDSNNEVCLLLFMGKDKDGKGFYYKDLYDNGNLNNLSNACLVTTTNLQASELDITSKKSIGYVIDYNGVFAVAVGGFVFWMMLMYCISLGTRYVQLIYLQVIAPIPIMCNMVPGKDNMFSKWLKQSITTYLDLFIRVAIISLVMVLCRTILSNENNVILETMNSTTNTWMKIILVLGLLTFAKKAPELITELIPSSATKASGDFGLSFKKRTDNMLGGKTIGKAYEKGIGFLGNTAKAVAFSPFSMGRRAIAGIDSARQGKGFWNGVKKHPGKFGQWINKQYETFAPESYKAHQEKLEGQANVKEIDTKWSKGVKIARTLQKLNPGRDWKKSFDGTEDSYRNYEKIFKSEEFRRSKMAVDRASFNEEQYRFAQQHLNAGNESATLQIIGNDGVKRTVRFTKDQMRELSEAYDKAQKTLKGVETVHAEISRQYQDDAAAEAQFKFIKNNESNPANPNQTHEIITREEEPEEEIEPTERTDADDYARFDPMLDEDSEQREQEPIDPFESQYENDDNDDQQTV